MNGETQCAFCFETLAANLERRKPLSLSEVAHLWLTYHDDNGDGDNEDGGGAEADGQVNGEGQSATASGEISSPSSATSSAVRDLRPTSLNASATARLLAPSPSTASSSSISSTGTSTPNNSSSDASKSSSNSSFFSPSRSDRSNKTPAEVFASAVEYPLFVTWNTISKYGDKRLRGCIGTFEPLPLEDGLRNYALTSALEDTRFSPISKRELPTLQNAITILTNFEPASHPLDWEIGTHGIRISFTHHGRRYGSTYLPDVAKEQGWTKEETIASLMRKAGFNGKKDEWRSMRSFTVVRYRGEKSNLDYAAWKEWRDWVTEEHGL